MKNQCPTPPEYLDEVAALLADAMLRLRSTQLTPAQTGLTGLLGKEERSSFCKPNGE
jgi:hypothetical protein